MNNLTITILAFIGCILCSCHSKNQEMQQLFDQWVGKEIIFPTTLRPQVFNQDTNCISLLQKDYKILLHVDPSGCSECKLKLFKWLQIMNENKELENKLAFLFVVNAPNIQKIRVISRQNKFNHPIFYDIDGKMDEINKFPKDESFRCFLLDKNNKVLLMGNPVNNPKLLELYKKTIVQGGI